MLVTMMVTCSIRSAPNELMIESLGRRVGAANRAAGAKSAGELTQPPPLGILSPRWLPATGKEPAAVSERRQRLVPSRQLLFSATRFFIGQSEPSGCRLRIVKDATIGFGIKDLSRLVPISHVRTSMCGG
jgi:hypothetical protein